MLFFITGIMDVQQGSNIREYWPLCYSSRLFECPLHPRWEFWEPFLLLPAEELVWKEQGKERKDITISSFLALSAKLLLPRLLPDFFKPSRFFSTHSISLSLSSVWIISISRRGLTSPSTWMTSASSKARTTWKIPSTARTWERKEFPRPAPVEAP